VILEEGVGDHRHERMTMQALPGSALEMIKTEFFFQLLVSLLANPTRLDGGRQGAQVGLSPAGWRDTISSLRTSCVAPRHDLAVASDGVSGRLALEISLPARKAKGQP
jgi:hypothetical protein